MNTQGFFKISESNQSSQNFRIILSSGKREQRREPDFMTANASTYLTTSKLPARV
jgi:hypothetical protein